MTAPTDVEQVAAARHAIFHLMIDKRNRDLDASDERFGKWNPRPSLPLFYASEFADTLLAAVTDETAAAILRDLGSKDSS